MNELHDMLVNLRLAVFDFDGVFTNNLVEVNDKGEEAVICNRMDGIGLGLLAECGVSTFILSSEKSQVVSHRARKLNIECFHGVDNKLEVLTRETTRRDILLDHTAYVGNDINDAECLQAVGLPVVVADAWPDVRRLAKWILERKGGEGAVREFCDKVWRAKKDGHFHENKKYI